jgi:hypothetical protein
MIGNKVTTNVLPPQFVALIVSAGAKSGDGDPFDIEDCAAISAWSLPVLANK